LVDKNKTTTNQLVSSINDFERSRVAALDNYVNSLSSMNKRTAHEYSLRLNRFQHFVLSRYGVTLDDIISRINEGSDNIAR
jgi:hypothetical protein